MDYQWLVSALIVAAGLAIGLWQYFESRRKQLLIDLQGDKDAVAVVAMGVQSGRFPRRLPVYSTRRRCELFEALCIAAVFERSGRSRSLIYGALASAARRKGKYSQEIVSIVDRTTVIVSRSSAYTDMTRARRRLVDLRAALSFDKDVRIRLDAFELSASTEARDWPPDPRLRNEAFASASLERLIDRMGSLVLVGPPEGSDDCPVIALDFHRVVRKPDRDSPEESALTALGDQVVAGKHRARERPGADQIAMLGRRLASLIKENPSYARASAVAAVPGRRHDFSGELGKDVAKRVNKRFVPLTIERDSFYDPRFAVGDSDWIKSRKAKVIVVDDVYRTGRTLQAAARSLLGSGASEVLGLAATCTISAAVSAGCHDGCARDAGRLRRLQRPLFRRAHS